MYRPTSTNGTPQSRKKSGAPLLYADHSQNTANPVHMIANAVTIHSEAPNTQPCRGCPDHSSRSRGPSSALSALVISAGPATLMSEPYRHQPAVAVLAAEEVSGHQLRNIPFSSAPDAAWANAAK